MERKFLWVALAILLILVIAATVLVLGREESYRGVRYDPPVPAYDFTLSAPDGATVSLHDFRGRIVLLFFGYTSCPDVCPTTLAILRQVRLDLGEQAGQVQVIYVTVDPERDLPERIQTYVSAFDATFAGLSGDLESLQAAWDAYGVFREIDESTTSAVSYLVSHSAGLYLIAPDGSLTLYYSYGTPAEDIVHDIRLIGRK